MGRDPAGRPFLHCRKTNQSRWLHRQISGGCDDWAGPYQDQRGERYIASLTKQAPAVWCKTVFEPAVPAPPAGADRSNIGTRG